MGRNEIQKMEKMNNVGLDSCGVRPVERSAKLHAGICAGAVR